MVQVNEHEQGLCQGVWGGACDECDRWFDEAVARRMKAAMKKGPATGTPPNPPKPEPPLEPAAA